MFEAERVPALLSNVSLNIVELKEETRRIVTCNFAIAPLGYELARDIGAHIADHLFKKVKKQNPTDEGHAIRHEVTSIEFQIDTKKFYVLRLFAAVDEQLPSSVHVGPCVCSALRVTRSKSAPIYVCKFNVTFDMPEPKELLAVVGQWRKTERTFLTFSETAPPLDYGERDLTGSADGE